MVANFFQFLVLSSLPNPNYVNLIQTLSFDNIGVVNIKAISYFHQQ